MTDPADIDQAIQQDKEQHPDCFYSKQSSSRRAWLNGKSKTETLIRVLRNCPRKSPEEIYSDKKEEDGGSSTTPFTQPFPSDVDVRGDPGIFGGFPRLPFGGFGPEGGDPGMGAEDPWSLTDPAQMLDHMHRIMEGFGAVPGFFGRIFPDSNGRPSTDGESGVGRQYVIPPPAPHHFPRGQYKPDSGHQRVPALPRQDVEEV